MTQPPEAQPPPGGAPKGTIATLVSQLLAQAFDAPWKAVVVVVFVVIGGIGWVAYENRAALIESWLTPSAPELKDTEVLTAALEKLASDTDADLIQIWSVSIHNGNNSQNFIAARRHDGERPVIPNPRRLPVIDSRSDIEAIEHVLTGRPACVDLTAAGTALARRLAERGFARGCAVPIPPSGEELLGVIYLIWNKPADASNENVAVGAAREAAKQLATH
jgi:hypothetical protein